MKRMMAILLAMLLLITSSAAEGYYVPFVIPQPTTEENYVYAWNAVGYGDYSHAAKRFADLGDYQDSAELAYLLGVSAYAEEMTSIGGNVIAYAFHGQWGLINLDEKVLIAPTWESIEYLNGVGLVKVSVGGLYGYVNAVGETVIPCEWRGISDFSGSLCTVMTHSGKPYYGLLDSTGAVVTPATWRELGASRNGYAYAPVFTNERIVVRGAHGYGIMDSDGNLLGNAEWDAAPDLTQTYPIVRKYSLYGFINLDGQVIVPVQYRAVQNFSDGLAAVKTESMLWQYIDPTGAVIIPPVYEDAQPFSGGVAHVQLPEMHWQIIDTQGQLLYFLTAQVKADYEAAVALMAEDNYEGAADLLQRTIGYLDSYTILLEAYRLAPLKVAYDSGMALVAADRLGEALSYLQAASGYKDADDQFAAAQSTLYERGVNCMAAEAYIEAENCFAYIPDYLDAAALAAKARQLAPKKQAYDTAMALVAKGQLTNALSYLQAASGYKDADDQFAAAQSTLYERGVTCMAAEAYTEAENCFAYIPDYLDAAALAAKARQLAPKKQAYDTAMALVAKGQLTNALSYFANASGYKDADAQLLATQEAIYQLAVDCMTELDYFGALELFDSISGYKDVEMLMAVAVQLCPPETEVQQLYDKARILVAAGQLVEALPYFRNASGYRDADEQLLATQEAIYQMAVGSMDDGNYATAWALFKSVSGYKDAKTLMNTASTHLKFSGFRVENIGTYGFVMNDDGYYESSNQGVPNSYAMCTVAFTSPTGYVYIDYINRGQVRKDYGLISVLDGTLSRSPVADEANVLLDMATRSTPKVQTLCVEVPKDEFHVLTIKFIKDGTGNQFNDSLQFRLRFK